MFSGSLHYSAIRLMISFQISDGNWWWSDWNSLMIFFLGHYVWGHLSYVVTKEEWNLADPFHLPVCLLGYLCMCCAKWHATTKSFEPQIDNLVIRRLGNVNTGHCVTQDRPSAMCLECYAGPIERVRRRGLHGGQDWSTHPVGLQATTGVACDVNYQHWSCLKTHN